MRGLFSFSGKVGRVGFILPAVVVFTLPHLLISTWLEVLGAAQPWKSPQFLLMPLRWIIGGDGGVFSAQSPVSRPHVNLIFLAVAGLTVVSSWALSALAVRRANDAQLTGWVALAAITPIVQIPIFLLLAIAPPKSAIEPPEAKPAFSWAAAVQGLLIATGLTLLVVAIGALIFKSYGYGLFVLSPVVIGATTAYVANRRASMSWGETVKVVNLALALGGVSLVVCALEGVVCIIMAAPLAWVMALVGAAVGCAMAERRGGNPMASFAILPLLFLPEQLLPTTIPFSDTMSVEVAAAPDEVWPAVLQMETITDKPSLPFQLGVAYPVRGEVTGEGVGAVRRGYFSTGVAVEHVTEWAPGRALGFDIVSEPPTLRELSPYKHVNAPHVEGYFRSVHARISLQPIGPDRTRLTLATTHELDLQPGFYWLPMAHWVVRQNKIRVLGQMRAQAEQANLDRTARRAEMLLTSRSAQTVNRP